MKTLPLSLIRKPQNIAIGIIVLFVSYLAYDYQSLKRTNEQYTSQMASEARERAFLQSRYDGLSERLKRQEQAFSNHIEALEAIRKDNESLRQDLQEITDERIRESLDTELDTDFINRLFNNVHRNAR